MSEKKKVRIGFEYLKDPKYFKIKDYVRAKYDYLASLGRLELGDRESLETDIQWRLISDMMEFMDQIELLEDVSNQKVTTLRVDR